MGDVGEARPAYDAGGLAGVLPAVATSLGVAGMGDDALGLPATNRAVVVLIDGLGLVFLPRHSRAHHPGFGGTRWTGAVPKGKLSRATALW